MVFEAVLLNVPPDPLVTFMPFVIFSNDMPAGRGPGGGQASAENQNSGKSYCACVLF